MPSSDGDGNKRLAIIGISSLFLVAMVVGVTIGVNNADDTKKKDLSSSRKAVDNICQPTDYKETCTRTLQKAAPGKDDPKELVKAAFNAALEEINKISEHSNLLKELQKDPKTAKAVEVCKDLFKNAADDFRRSADQIGKFDLNNMDKILANLKIWLSATVTYQETCLDAFDNTTGEASENMEKLLNTTMEMSSNSIAIVSGMSEAVGNLQLDGISTSGSRRLLSTSWSKNYISSHDVFMDADFVESMLVYNHKKGKPMIGHDDVVPRWFDFDDRRRKLLQAKLNEDLKPNVVVARDGSGKYKKIVDALGEIPKNCNNPFVIYVKEGVYKEYVKLEKWHTHVVLIGDGPTKTRISGNLNFIDKTPTCLTSTLTVLGDYFMAKDIGVENTAGAIKHQAVAMRVQSDQAIFYNCQFDGYQDTLYTHTYRQYYRDCKISGTIDFVFGDAAAFFQNCTFIVRKPLDNQDCIVTAQGRKERHQPTGIIIHKSTVIADPEYYPVRFTNKAYLGRPWKEYSKTIFMESHLDDLINQDGWLPWNGTFGINTCYYGEYNNDGQGANMAHRVKWPGVKTILPTRAEKFMPPVYFAGDDWIKATGVPYMPTLSSDPSAFALPPGYADEDPNAPIGSPSDLESGSMLPSSESSKKSPPESSSNSPDKSSSGSSSDSSSKSSEESSSSSSSEFSSKSPSKSPKESSSESSSKSSSKSPDESSSQSSSKSPNESSSSKSSSKSPKESSSESSSKTPEESSSTSSSGTSNPSSSTSNGSSSESSKGPSIPSSEPGSSSGSSTGSPKASTHESSSSSPSPPESSPVSPPEFSLVSPPESSLVSPPLAPSVFESPSVSPNPSLSLTEDSSTPSESPASMVNLERTLMQTNYDEKDNVEDEKISNILYHKTRSDLSLSPLLHQTAAPGPSPMSSMLSKYHIIDGDKSPSSSAGFQKTLSSITDMVKGLNLRAHLGSNLSPRSTPAASPSPFQSKRSISLDSKMTIKDLEKELMKDGNEPSPARIAPSLPRSLAESKEQATTLRAESEKPNLSPAALNDLASSLGAMLSQNSPLPPEAAEALKKSVPPGATADDLAAAGQQATADAEPSKPAEKSGSKVVYEIHMWFSIVAVLIALFM